MKRHIEIIDDCGAILDEAFNIAKAAHSKCRYLKVTESDVMSHYNKARDQHLRYDRETNIMRDNRLGVLSRPSDPSEWGIATLHEARESMAREIWCSAVAAYNRNQMS